MKDLHMHAPKFKSCVLVNGKNYVSGGTFPKRKEAEQDAAKVALENITETRNDGGNSSIQDPTYCKLILFEYAVKMNLKRPEYSTTGGEQMRPVFMSTLVFDGKVYKGEEARSKKITEQLAARVAIRSLLEFDSGILQQIINSKSRVQDAVLEVKNPSVNQSNLPAPSTPAVRISESLRRVTAHRKNCDAIYSFKVNLGGMLPFSSVQEQFSYALEN